MLAIFTGLGGAAAQSLSYLYSKHLVDHHRRSPLQVLVLAHVLMGGFSVVLLPFYWRTDMPPWSEWFWPLFGSTATYLVGQIGLFYVLRHTQASRVSPLLSIKVIMLATLATALLHQPLSGLQWLAVFLCASAALVLNTVGGRIATRAVIALLITCLMYSLSDLYIKVMLDSLGKHDPVANGVLGTALTYLLAGIAAAALLPWLGSRRAGEWGRTTPYALAWFLGMIGLYACIALADVVLANILQSTRGLFSVMLGVVAAHAGLLHLEPYVGRRILVQRILASLMMSGAVALYVLG